MKGTILGYSETEKNGLIRGEEGQRYRFGRDDWRGERDPRPGMEVDFEARDGKALEIYPLGGASPSLADARKAAAELAGAVAENEAVAKAGEKVRELARHFSFGRSPLGISAALAYIATLFMSALTLSKGMLGVSFALIDQTGGKVAFVIALAAAVCYGIGERGKARLLSLAALLAPPVVLLGATYDFAQGMSFGMASRNEAFQMAVKLAMDGLDTGFFLALLAALVMALAPAKKRKS